MCDIIPKTSENCAPLSGAPWGGWERYVGPLLLTVCSRMGYIKEGRKPTAPNVRAHLTINLSKLPSAPGAVLCADICPASVQYEDSARGNSPSYIRHHLTWRKWRRITPICVVYHVKIVSDVGDYDHLTQFWM